MASSYDVAHNWAHQLKPRLGGKRDNVTFEGTRLYSYSTVIGDIIDFPNGNRVYVINDGTFSQSTSKHQGYMRGAIPTDAHMFSHKPKRLGFEYGWNGAIWGLRGRSEINRYAMWWLDTRAYAIVDELEDYKNSRTLTLETNAIYMLEYREMLRFIQVTGCTTMKKFVGRKNIEWGTRYGNRYSYNTKVSEEAKRKARKVIKAIMAGASLEELVDLVNGKGTYAAYVKRTQGARTRMGQTPEEREAIRLKRQKTMAEKEARMRLERHLQWVKRDEDKARVQAVIESGDWAQYRELYHDCIVDGYGYSCVAELYRGGNVMMRYNPALELVETTKGIKLTVAECKRLWKLVQRWHANQSSFEAGESAKSRGYGQGWEIRAYLHDVLYAGCHAIAYEEMRDLAVKLGIA